MKRSKNTERLMRGILAAIVGSKLTISEMRFLAELLIEDRRFSHELGKFLYDVSYRLGSQSRFDMEEPAHSSLQSQSFDGLTDLAYTVVQRRRLSRAKIFEVFAKIGMGARVLGVPRDAAIREILDAFFAQASSSQVAEFMSFLGMDVAQDAYLGVIGKRG